jgi:hypothetical protein
MGDSRGTPLVRCGTLETQNQLQRLTDFVKSNGGIQRMREPVRPK